MATYPVGSEPPSWDWKPRVNPEGTSLTPNALSQTLVSSLLQYSMMSSLWSFRGKRDALGRGYKVVDWLLPLPGSIWCLSIPPQSRSGPFFSFVATTTTKTTTWRRL